MPNELINETSPYLLQHAYNPVHWYAWGPIPWQRAADENKLVLVSIGYSACHWCHVMERESFVDQEVALVMNQYFICIKVDREERPDLDQIYLEAVQLMSGHAGWPLNCFTLPNQQPVYGGTYFRREDWKNILKNLNRYWIDTPGDAIGYAGSVLLEMEAIEAKSQSIIGVPGRLPAADQLFKAWAPTLDRKEGGFRGIPKFPLPGCWQFLLGAVHTQAGDSENIRPFLSLTLSKMAQGGIYDQLGGGFARYSTDGQWLAPHFEKMLYDNAQLLSLYSDGYRWFGDDEYRRIIQETIQFLVRDLQGPEGGYFSALDADSEGVEGKYYLWSQQELKTLLGSLAPVFSLEYNVLSSGNWEGTNILHRRPTSPTLAEKLGLSPEEFFQEINRCKRTLMTYRAARIPPALDDKIVCSWNALLVKGFCDAYRTTGLLSTLDLARGTMNFLGEKCVQGDQIFRSYKNKLAKIAGFLDDYVFMADAMISLYQCTFESRWIYQAETLVETIFQKFQDTTSPLFYYTSAYDTPLITRKKEIHDSVTPASNSVLAWILAKLAHYLDRDEWAEQSRRMLAAVETELLGHGPSYYNWSALAVALETGFVEISIIGPQAEDFRKELENTFIPYMLLSGHNPLFAGHESGSLDVSDQGAGSFSANQSPGPLLPVLSEKMGSDSSDLLTRIYICQNKVCRLPVISVTEAINLLEII